MKPLITTPAKKPRISTKLREAMRLRIRRGMTITDACEKAGISPSGWHKAMGRQAVRDAFAEEAADYISEVEVLRASAKVQAIEVALELMKTAKSENVRARMAEFLASEGKAVGHQVNVTVDARNTGGGYEFVRPDEKLVEIEAEQNPSSDANT